MVIFSPNVSALLNGLNARFLKFRSGNDYAQTAYRNWHNQIMNAFKSLDKTTNKYGTNIKLSLPYFGTITYNAYASQTTVIIIDEFDLNTSNFTEWIHNIPRGMTISGFNNLPQSLLTIPQGWNKGNRCSNGFDIIWTEDENCHTLYNYAYNDKVVFTTEKKGETVPMVFTWVSDFKKNPQGIWAAKAKYYKYEYLLKQDGECIRNGVTELIPHKERNVSQSEYNHYRRYLQGDSKVIKGNLLKENKQSKLDRIITEVLNNFLRRELLIA